MNRPLNVLVFPSSTEIGLEINQALRYCKEVRLFGAAQPGYHHGPYAFASHHEVEPVGTAGWLEQLNGLLQSLSIDAVYPAHDDVIVALAEHRDHVGATCLVPPLPQAHLLRSKRATYSTFAGILPTPEVYASPSDVVRYPVFAKPDRGQGAQGAHVVANERDLGRLMADWPRWIVTEHLPGAEFTVDCLSDSDGNLVFCGGRSRDRIRNGIAAATAPVERPEFLRIARIIARELKLVGAWFFQLKEAGTGTLTLLEIAPRVAGTMALHRATGVNFPLLGLWAHLGRPFRTAPHRLPIALDRALVNRYRLQLEYDTLYIDLDDTIIVRGRANPLALRLVHQCIDRGIRIELITRHAEVLETTLARHRLAGLFDRIHHLREAQPKATVIDPARRAIFVDDSFSERQAVADAVGIPTFDPSMLESLIDDRAWT